MGNFMSCNYVLIRIRECVVQKAASGGEYPDGQCFKAAIKIEHTQLHVVQCGLHVFYPQLGVVIHSNGQLVNGHVSIKKAVQ